MVDGREGTGCSKLTRPVRLRCHKVGRPTSLMKGLTMKLAASWQRKKPVRKTSYGNLLVQLLLFGTNMMRRRCPRVLLNDPDMK